MIYDMVLLRISTVVNLQTYFPHTHVLILFWGPDNIWRAVARRPADKMDFVTSCQLLDSGSRDNFSIFIR